MVNKCNWHSFGLFLAVALLIGSSGGQVKNESTQASPLTLVGNWFAAYNEDDAHGKCPTYHDYEDRITISSAKTTSGASSVLSTRRLATLLSGGCTFAGRPGDSVFGKTQLVETLTSHGYIQKRNSAWEMALGQSTCEGDCDFYGSVPPENRAERVYVLRRLSKDEFTRITRGSGTEVRYRRGDRAPDEPLAIADTVRYINKLLDSGLGARDKYYAPGHIIADPGSRTVSWTRRIQLCKGTYAQCYPGFEYALFRAKAVSIAGISTGKDANTIPGYRNDTTPEPDVVLDCSGEKACFQEWTLFKDSTLDLSFEELSRLPDLEFVGKDAVHVQIFTTGDEEMTARLVRALNHLITELQTLSKSDSSDPFAK
jgi:hypothetical protein